jgi:hypothetical protein
MDFKKFYEASSDGSKTGLLGPGIDGKNYYAFSPDKTLNPEQIQKFNGEFQRLINDTTRAAVENLKNTKTTSEIKEILSGIDSYFGRPLGFLGRKIDNQNSLPVSLQKTWFKNPNPDSGVAFTADERVEL